VDIEMNDTKEETDGHKPDNILQNFSEQSDAYFTPEKVLEIRKAAAKLQNRNRDLSRFTHKKLTIRYI
jgi:hypothetical protein